jgi:hypothetical protein
MSTLSYNGNPSVVDGRGAVRLMRGSVEVVGRVQREGRQRREVAIVWLKEECI